MTGTPRFPDHPLSLALAARGWSAVELSRRTGVQQTTISRARLGRSTMPHIRERLALALEVPEDDLFPGAVDADLPDLPSLDADPSAHRLEGSRHPEQALDIAELRAALESALALLTPREDRVLRMRYGLDGQGPGTLSQVGHQFGLCHNRIRQIEGKALRRLGHPSRSKYLDPGANDPPPVPQVEVRTIPRPERHPAPRPAPQPQPPPDRPPPTPPGPTPFQLWMDQQARLPLYRSVGETAWLLLRFRCCRGAPTMDALRRHFETHANIAPESRARFDALEQAYQRR